MYKVVDIIKTVQFNNIKLEQILESFFNINEIDVNKKIDQVTAILYLLNPTAFPELIFFAETVRNREKLEISTKILLIFYLIYNYDNLNYKEILNIWKEII